MKLFGPLCSQFHNAKLYLNFDSFVNQKNRNVSIFRCESIPGSKLAPYAIIF